MHCRWPSPLSPFLPLIISQLVNKSFVVALRRVLVRHGNQHWWCVLWAGMESHAGQVFTCVAALHIAGAVNRLDKDLTCWW